MAKYEAVWGGDDPGALGVFDTQTGKMVLSVWELHQLGYTAQQVCGWSGQKLEKFVKKQKGELKWQE